MAQKNQLLNFLNTNFKIDLSSTDVLVDPDFVLKNGHVQYLYFSAASAPLTRTIDTILNFFNRKGHSFNNQSIVKYRVRSLQDTFNNLKKNIQRNWQVLEELFNSNFNITPSTRPMKRVLDSDSPTGNQQKKRVVADDHSDGSEATNEKENSTPSCPFNKRQCPHRRDLVSFITTLKAKLKEARGIAALVKKNYSVSKINQDYKRRQILVDKYREEKRTLKKNNLALIKKNIYLQSQVGSISKLKRAARKNQHRIRDLKETVSSLKASLEEAARCVEEVNKKLANNNSSQGLENFRQGKAYDAPFRKCIYACLVGQVPVERAGHLVRFILNELTELSVNKVPSPSTIAQMAYEMGVMSNLQLAEHLYMTPHSVTLAWDATTIDGSHYNEINFSLGDRTFTLEVGKLSGGATIDYFQHIGDSVRNLATFYAIFTGIQQHLILHKFQQTIQTTLTDRAPVNNCVSQELSHLLCKQLVKLNCNLHPLDGLATEAKKTLKVFDAQCEEREKAGIFGQEGRAANLIYAISKLRYKTNSGDPGIFKAFLRMSGLNVGVIVRYVGNRLHILFHSAGVIIHLQGVLLMFLKKYCSNNPFRLSLINELEHPFVIVQLRVLGLFGKMLTGPWMTVFYQNEAKLKHLEMIPVMKTCLTRLQSISLDPECLLHWTTDCFERPVNTEDQVLRALRGATACNMFREVTKSLSEAFCRVLERQLSDYLKGTLSVVTDELQLKTSSAPLHNMHSERALGMFDSQCHRSRNSTVGFKEGKIRFTLNRTLDWLGSKPQDLQQKIVEFSRRCGAKVRKEVKAKEVKYQAALTERLTLMAQRREDEERKILEKALKNGDRQRLAAVTAEVKFVCELILINSSSLVGRTLHHIWAEGNVQKIYRGTVKKIKDSNIFILYDGENQITKLSGYALIADIILGDASFTM